MNTVQYKCPQCNQYWQMYEISVMALSLGQRSDGWWYTDVDGNRLKKCPKCEKTLPEIRTEILNEVQTLQKEMK